MIGSKQALADWIRAGDDFMVCVHVRPDGDAYGTALALVEAIRALGKRAFAACDDAVAPKYKFLPGSDDFHTLDDMPYAPKYALSADSSTIDRIGKLEKAFFAAPYRAVLDHHNVNEAFAPVSYIDSDAAAAGELALDVIDALGVALTKDMALNLYVAISTDCGNFNFQNTGARTYRYAARLVEAGVDVESVTHTLYRSRTYAQTKLLCKALEQIKLHGDGRVAGVKLPKRIFEETGTTNADAHNVVNYTREIQGVVIGFSAEETHDCVKLSFRSMRGVSVEELAKRFGGGGHTCAAGANAYGFTLDEAYSRAADAAVELIKSLDGA